MLESLVLKLRRQNSDLSEVGVMAAGDLLFRVSCRIFSWASSGGVNEQMCLLLLGMCREDEGKSSGGGVDIEGSDCCSIASIGDQGSDPGMLEVSGTSLSQRSSSDSGEMLDSLSFVTSGKGWTLGTNPPIWDYVSRGLATFGIGQG
jgi:hypothetical protein